MRDRGAVNGKAMRTLGVLYPNVIDIGCFSHMLDLVGDNFKTPSLWSTGWSFTSIATKQDWFGEKRGGVSGSVKNRLCFCGEMFRFFFESADAAPKSRARLKCLLESHLTNLLIELNCCHNRCWWIFCQGLLHLRRWWPSCTYLLQCSVHRQQSRFNTGQHTCYCLPVSFPNA